MSKEKFLIDAQDVTVSYPTDNGGRLTVIDDVSLKVSGGELLTVVGPSGCGKSTLLRLVLGSQLPNAGTVLVDGKQVKTIDRDCGIVYQNYSLFPHLTVLDNIGLGHVLETTGLLERFLARPLIGMAGLVASVTARISGSKKSTPSAEGEQVDRSELLDFIRYYRARREARLTASSLLADIGLQPSDGDKYPHELSGGMRQRVAIAQALIMKPKILLMDEPFGALDKASRREMQDFIHSQWKRYGLTVFFVTHDLPEACKLGTRLICLSQYWKGDDGSPSSGARIVVDRKVHGGEVLPSSFVACQEFESLVEQVGRAGLDREHLQPQSAFDLSHPDAMKLV